MTVFLTTLRLWFSGLILIVATTLLAMAGPVVVRGRGNYRQRGTRTVRVHAQ
jgi:hypothetical protein